MTSIREKIFILKKAKSIFQNWMVYPFSYYNLIRSNLIVFKTRSGRIIKIRKNSTDLMALTHVWLIEEYAKPGFSIKPNDIVVDVGAHIGLFTIYASQFCTNGKIYSFEPIKENYELLLENIKSNNLKHVVPFNIAVSKSDKFLKLYLNEDESGHSMFTESALSIHVESTTLQKFFDDKNIEHCNFLKLDCEGAEYEIIKNLPSEYFKKIDKMVIEYHMADSSPELLAELKTILTNEKFDIDIKPLFPDIGFLYAVKLNSLDNSQS